MLISIKLQIPTDFTIRVIEPKQGGHFRSRNLLNIEKAVFTTGTSTQVRVLSLEVKFIVFFVYGKVFSVSSN